MKPKEHFHGSDLEKIERVYGIKKEDIIKEKITSAFLPMSTH